VSRTHPRSIGPTGLKPRVLRRVDVRRPLWCRPPPRPPLPPMKPPMGFYSVVKAVESTLWSFRPSRGSSSYTVEMGVPPIRAHARGRPRRVSQTIRSAPRSEAHCLRVSTKPLNSRHAGVVSRPRSNAGTAAWAPASKPPRARRCGRHLGPAFPPRSAFGGPPAYPACRGTTMLVPPVR
jgi:hypothetical protein